MNADKIIQCILAAMLKLEKSVDGIVEDQIIDGVVNKAPSQNAVYDALATIATNFSKFKIKLEDSFDYIAAEDLVGEDQVIPISAEGKASIVLEHDELQSLTGINYDNITGNTLAEIPHPGKPYFIFNNTDNPIILKHVVGTASGVYKPFKFYNNEDMVLPPGGMAEFKLNNITNTLDKVPGGAVVINDLTTGGTSDALSAEMGVFLKSLIDSVFQPDILISSIPPVRSGNTFTYPANGYEAMINKTRRTNALAFSTTISTASTIDHKRIDLVYFKSDNTLDKLIGTESLITAERPTLPANSVEVSFININGNTISDPTTITDELSVQDSLGVERFKASSYIRFKGASFNSGAKQIEIDPLVAGVIFVSSTGNDALAEPENRNKPYKTLDAAINSFFAFGMNRIEIVTSTVFTVSRSLNNGTSKTFNLYSEVSPTVNITYNGVYGMSDAQQLIFNMPSATLNLVPTTSASFGNNQNRAYVNIKAKTLTKNSLFYGDYVNGFKLDCDILNITGSSGLVGPMLDGVNEPVHTITARKINFTGAGASIFSSGTSTSGTILLDFDLITHDNTFTITGWGNTSINHGSISGSYASWVNYAPCYRSNTKIYYKTGSVISSNVGFDRFNNDGQLTLEGVVNYSNTDCLFKSTNLNNVTIVNSTLTCKAFLANRHEGTINIINSTINVTSFFGNIANNFNKTYVNPILTFRGMCFILGTGLADNFNLISKGDVFATNNLFVDISKGILYTNGKFDRSLIGIIENPLNQYYDTIQRQLVLIDEKQEIVNKVLDSTKTYVINGVITLLTGEYIDVPAGGLTISGYGYDTSGFNKNVSGQSIFRSPEGNSGNLTLKDCFFNSGAGTVFNLTDNDGTHALEFNDVNFNNCSSLGIFTGYRQFTATTCGLYGCSDGITLEGTWNGFKMTNSNVIGFGASGTLVKKGSSTLFNNRLYLDLNISIATGSKICDFDSTNFAVDKLLQVVNCLVKVAGVIDSTTTGATFPNITPFSSKSYFTNNIGLKNSFIEPYGLKNTNLSNYANDAAAASGGVEVGEVYVETSTGYFKTRLI